MVTRVFRIAYKEGDVTGLDNGPPPDDLTGDLETSAADVHQGLTIGGLKADTDYTFWVGEVTAGPNHSRYQKRSFRTSSYLPRGRWYPPEAIAITDPLTDRENPETPFGSERRSADDPDHFYFYDPPEPPEPPDSPNEGDLLEYKPGSSTDSKWNSLSNIRDYNGICPLTFTNDVVAGDLFRYDGANWVKILSGFYGLQVLYAGHQDAIIDDLAETSPAKVEQPGDLVVGSVSAQPSNLISALSGRTGTRGETLIEALDALATGSPLERIPAGNEGEILRSTPFNLDDYIAFPFETESTEADLPDTLADDTPTYIYVEDIGIFRQAPDNDPPWEPLKKPKYVSSETIYATGNPAAFKRINDGPLYAGSLFEFIWDVDEDDKTLSEVLKGRMRYLDEEPVGPLESGQYDPDDNGNLKFGDGRLLLVEDIGRGDLFKYIIGEDIHGARATYWLLQTISGSAKGYQTGSDFPEKAKVGALFEFNQDNSSPTVHPGFDGILDFGGNVSDTLSEAFRGDLFVLEEKEANDTLYWVKQSSNRISTRIQRVTNGTELDYRLEQTRLTGQDELLANREIVTLQPRGGVTMVDHGNRDLEVSVSALRTLINQHLSSSYHADP